MTERVLVIGAGITGLFATMYLSKSGVKVVLIDKGDVLSGTSGRFHGMLHSGTRYTTNDSEAARECISENRKLYGMAQKFIRDTGGYFVALDQQEADFGDRILESNKKNGIPTDEVDVEIFKKKIEPNISPEAKRVLRIPDKVIRAYELGMSVASESMNYGARILTHTEASLSDSNRITIRGHPEIDGNFDCVVNTAGPWAMDVAKKMGMKGLTISPALGYMSVYPGRLVNSVINRMRPPSDGDILVPYGENTILGTIAVLTEDPDNPRVDQDDLELMHEEGSKLVPELEPMRHIRTYYSSRPLISSDSDTLRTASRDYTIMEQNTGIRQIAIAGGKFSTARLMGKQISSMVLGNNQAEVGKDDINLNDSMKRFLTSIGDGNLLRAVYSRIGTIDEEIISSSMASMVNYVIEERSGRAK